MPARIRLRCRRPAVRLPKRKTPNFHARKPYTADNCFVSLLTLAPQSPSGGGSDDTEYLHRPGVCLANRSRNDIGIAYPLPGWSAADAGWKDPIGRGARPFTGDEA